MNIYAVSDLHLSNTVNKPMDIFGDNWDNHWQKIQDDWRERVNDEDIVLLAGDLSWGINLDEAKEDLSQICSMPGIKIMIKGNHDYWHNSLKKTNEILFNQSYFIQNNSVHIGEYAFAGTRGWLQEGDAFTEEDRRIYLRELNRLELSLKSIPAGFRKIAMMHYPPFSIEKGETEFTRLFEKYGVEKVIYGHIHGSFNFNRGYDNISINGVEYILTSCDYLKFKLTKII